MTLSVRQALRGKQILLVGVTGFIGKVWLEHVLSEIPEIGKIYLLIRRQRNTTAGGDLKRSWKRLRCSTGSKSAMAAT